MNNKNLLENNVYKRYSSMSKVNFLGMLLHRYFSEKIIGKEENSAEYEELAAIMRLLEDRFIKVEDIG